MFVPQIQPNMATANTTNMQSVNTKIRDLMPKMLKSKGLSQNGYRTKPKARNVNIHKFCEDANKWQTRKHDKS